MHIMGQWLIPRFSPLIAISPAQLLLFCSTLDPVGPYPSNVAVVIADYQRIASWYILHIEHYDLSTVPCEH